MELCAETSVDCHSNHSTVIKPTSFTYEHYRRPVVADQLIAHESYPPQQVPQQRHGSPYHHSYHRHHYQQQQLGPRGGRYDDVMESQCVTSFIELQPAAPRVPVRSVAVDTPPRFTSHHSHQCEYYIRVVYVLCCAYTFSVSHIATGAMRRELDFKVTWIAWRVERDLPPQPILCSSTSPADTPRPETFSRAYAPQISTLCIKLCHSLS